MARFDAHALDKEIVNALRTRGSGPTYYIRNCLDWPGKPFHRRGLKTSHVLTACRRLERRGEIIPAWTSYSVMKAWELAPEIANNTDEEGK